MTGHSLTYLIESLPWAVAGFLAGCLATLQVQPTPVAPREIHMASPEAPKSKRRFKPTLVHLIGLVVIAITIAGAIQNWAWSRANERLTQCLVTYANGTADAIEIRSKASSDAQVAQVQVWRAVFQQAPTEEGRQNARRIFDEYLTKQEKSLQAQQSNPFPAAPRDVCPDSAR